MNNPEQLPSFEKIRTKAGAEHELTRDNTAVFQYLGSLAVYDHIYVTPENVRPIYLWRYEPESGKEADFFHFIKPKAIENDCQTLLNLQKVSDKDVEKYVEHAKRGLTDEAPNWGAQEGEN